MPLANVLIRATEIDGGVRVDVTDPAVPPTQGAWAVADDLATATLDAIRLYGLESAPLERSLEPTYTFTTRETIERELRDAIAVNRVVRIDYRSVRSEVTRDREIEPLRITSGGESIFAEDDRLIARDVDREGVRTFLLDRILKVVIR